MPVNLNKVSAASSGIQIINLVQTFGIIHQISHQVFVLEQIIFLVGRKAMQIVQKELVYFLQQEIYFQMVEATTSFRIMATVTGINHRQKVVQLNKGKSIKEILINLKNMRRSHVQMH